jgi:hypothetical protein
MSVSNFSAFRNALLRCGISTSPVLVTVLTTVAYETMHRQKIEGSSDTYRMTINRNVNLSFQ